MVPGESFGRRRYLAHRSVGSRCCSGRVGSDAALEDMSEVVLYHNARELQHQQRASENGIKQKQEKED